MACMVRHLINIMFVSKMTPHFCLLVSKAINLPGVERFSGDCSMLIKGRDLCVLHWVAGAPVSSRAMCICLYIIFLVVLPWQCNTLAIVHYSQFVGRTCGLMKKHLRMTAVNNSGKRKGYVQYIKRDIKNLGLPKGGNAYGNGVLILGPLRTEVGQLNLRGRFIQL